MYATIATVGGRRYRGATNVGRRPTFGGGQMTVETHLLEFDVRRSVVGEPFSVEFVRRIREERAFSGPEALGQQIARDVAQVRELLVTVGPGIIR